MNSTQNLAQ